MKVSPGVTGNITLDPQRNARKPAVMLRMEGGKPHYVVTIYPAEKQGGRGKMRTWGLVRAPRVALR
jgi:hypothetical protein